MYHTGKRTRDWRKLKIVQEQEFVVGGWTESRTTGRPFGALLLGYYEDGALDVCRATQGAASIMRELERVIRLLNRSKSQRRRSRRGRKTNERPHWTKPSLVAQLKFTEWTDDGLLRHPIYLGMRDDVKPETVRREKRRSSLRRESARVGESRVAKSREGRRVAKQTP